MVNVDIKRKDPHVTDASEESWLREPLKDGGPKECSRKTISSPSTGRRRHRLRRSAEEKTLLARFANAAGAGELLNIHDLKHAYEQAIPPELEGISQSHCSTALRSKRPRTVLQLTSITRILATLPITVGLESSLLVKTRRLQRSPPSRTACRHTDGQRLRDLWGDGIGQD